uniref:Phosphatidate cytidylyltransferase n=1 Tax=Heterorhabditis bacteriophora TaxID=37862 RepID=A0A1I7WI68_HETBA
MVISTKNDCIHTWIITGYVLIILPLIYDIGRIGIPHSFVLLCTIQLPWTTFKQVGFPTALKWMLFLYPILLLFLLELLLASYRFLLSSGNLFFTASRLQQALVGTILLSLLYYRFILENLYFMASDQGGRTYCAFLNIYIYTNIKRCMDINHSTFYFFIFSYVLIEKCWKYRTIRCSKTSWKSKLFIFIDTSTSPIVLQTITFPLPKFLITLMSL